MLSVQSGGDHLRRTIVTFRRAEASYHHQGVKQIDLARNALDQPSMLRLAGQQLAVVSPFYVTVAREARTKGQPLALSRREKEGKPMVRIYFPQ